LRVQKLVGANLGRPCGVVRQRQSQAVDTNIEMRFFRDFTDDTRDLVLVGLASAAGEQPEGLPVREPAANERTCVVL
jgi:hypothetical protein